VKICALRRTVSEPGGFKLIIHHPTFTQEAILMPYFPIEWATTAFGVNSSGQNDYDQKVGRAAQVRTDSRLLQNGSTNYYAAQQRRFPVRLVALIKTGCLGSLHESYRRTMNQALA
jgi:hypothetical protein